MLVVVHVKLIKTSNVANFSKDKILGLALIEILLKVHGQFEVAYSFKLAHDFSVYHKNFLNL